MSDPIRLEGVPPRSGGRRNARVPRRTSVIRLRHLVWVLAVAGLAYGVMTYGTPHLRVRYEYTGPDSMRHYVACDYAGWSGGRYLPPNGRCPLILFIKPADED